MNIQTILLCLLLAVPALAFSQRENFTRQDTLRGSVTPERAWWDLTYYHLKVIADPADSTLSGSNLIQYRVLKPGQSMQVDLQPPLKITRVEENGKPVTFKKDGNAWFISLSKKQVVGEVNEVTVFYEGKPKVSRRPPWDGGLTWAKDKNGNDFAVTTCQGDGASLWWPCKDHMYDEVDSMLISGTCPGTLTCVANGRLRSTDENKDGTKTFHWFVANPLNNYGVNINIGDYVHFSSIYKGEKGKLDCDYYVLSYNLDKGKKHFKEVPRMLKAFEHWFGPYPFYEDSYKLVEVPYWGMEHQSSVTYGNGYEMGAHGRDLSQSGWGMKFDFIIIHESGHEWFANNITYKDVADMWVHEGFTAYSENLFVDYHYGKEASNAYAIGTRSNIRNDRPIIGQYDVNYSGSSDMYSKGANMLHTIRHVIDDDEKWRTILRGLNSTFYHQTVTTAQIENYITKKSGKKLGPVFDQYLRDTRIPILEYRIFEDRIAYRWSNVNKDFNMPVKVYINGEKKWMIPNTFWDEMKTQSATQTFSVDANFYVATMNLGGVGMRGN